MTRRPDNTADKGQESLLSRWSRRKQRTDQAREDAPPSALKTLPRTPATPGMSANTSAATALSDEASASLTDDQPHSAVDQTIEPHTSDQLAQDSVGQDISEHGTDETPAIELPDPELLTPDADISAFMQPGVDPALRQRALRRIFMGGEHSLRDGLDDYDQDFSKMRPLAAGVAETLRRWTHKVEESLEALDEEELKPLEADTEEQDTALETKHETQQEQQEQQDKSHNETSTPDSTEPQTEATHAVDSDHPTTAAHLTSNDTSRPSILPR